MAEQHSLTADYETPYKFNGKELDSETGLYYYNARYYDPRTSIWLSTDPLMEKYPNVNPYAYCIQNPINYTDPTGMSVDGWVTTLNDDGTKTHTFDANVNSCDDAIAAGYQNITDVRQALSVTAKDGSYSYNLNANGTVTNALWGDVPVTMGNIYGTGYNFARTEGGTDILTNRIASNTRPQGGQITQMDFSSPFFPMGMVLGSAFKGLGAVSGAASPELTTVGRWMSQEEYSIMNSTGKMLEGAGGKTSVATGGFDSFSGAAKGSVYAEFQVPSSSLVQGGQSNWYSILGPNASKSQLFTLQKQGGQILPKVQNLSPKIKVK